MYRPVGWKCYNRTVYNAYNTVEQVFEAGADQMLRRLEEKGIRGKVHESAKHLCYVFYAEGGCDNFAFDIDKLSPAECNLTGSGTLVFIPDEPEELTLEKLDKALDVVKSKGSDMYYVESENTHIAKEAYGRN